MKMNRAGIFRFIAAFLILLLLLSFLSPQLSIRRYMLFKLHPIASLTTSITNPDRHDPHYGQRYDAEGFTDAATGETVDVFYLKKAGIFWCVAEDGSGP